MARKKTYSEYARLCVLKREAARVIVYPIPIAKWRKLAKQGHFKNSKSKMPFWCPVHQEYFWQSIVDHAYKFTKCSKCSKVYKYSVGEIARKIILEREKNRKPIYYIPIAKWKKIAAQSKTKRLTHTTEVPFVCPIHGEFYQTINAHLSALKGCKYCAGNVKRSLEELQKLSDEIHGGKYIILERLSEGKIKVKCKRCGNVFDQLVNNHINYKKGCKRCNVNFRFNYMSLEELQALSDKLHNGEYQILDVFMNEEDQPVLRIKHKKCGHVYTNKPHAHLVAKKKCKNCHKKYKYSTKNFQKKIDELHGKRRYEILTEYKGSHEYVTVKCCVCGHVWDVLATNLLMKRGCPNCVGKTSSYETTLETLLTNHGLSVERNVKGLLDNKYLELDLYLPEKQIALEFNGFPWHYSTPKFNQHPNGNFKRKHFEKTHQAFLNGIHLIHVFADTWTTRQPQLEDWIIRSCVPEQLEYVTISDIKPISQRRAYKFIKDNSILYKRKMSKVFGAFSDSGELVSVMTFAKSPSRLYEWQITNHVDKVGVFVDGSKIYLWNEFNRMYSPDSVYGVFPAEIYHSNYLSDIEFVTLKHTNPTCFEVSDDFERFKLSNKSKKGITKMWDAGNWHFSWRKRDKVLVNGK